MCFSMTADLVVGTALVPVAVLTLREVKQWREVPFAVLGAVVAGYLAVVVLTEPIGVTRCPHALRYQTGVHDGYVWAVLYVIAVIGPAVLSGYRSIVVFGWANLVGLVVVAVLYVQAFASLWCVYAAVLSVLVLVHMVRRRRLPDPHRYHGVAGERSVSSAV